MRIKLGKISAFMVLLLLSALFLLPLLVVLTNSFMSSFEVLNRYTQSFLPANNFGSSYSVHFAEFSLIPNMVSLAQYRGFLLDTTLYLGIFLNSLKIAVPIVAGQLLIAVPAAYSLEISSFRFKEPLFFIYIVIMLLPLQVTLVPNYVMAEFLHINGSYLAVILPAVFNPFGVFLMRQYMKGLRREYIEAAKIDGAGHIRIFCHVQLPLAKSAVASLAILMFIEYWNVVDQAVVFIREPMAMPLSVFLSYMVDDSGASVIFAGSCFYLLPVILVFLYGQEYMVEGIQLSGLK